MSGRTGPPSRWRNGGGRDSRRHLNGILRVCAGTAIWVRWTVPPAERCVERVYPRPGPVGVGDVGRRISPRIAQNSAHGRLMPNADGVLIYAAKALASSVPHW